MYWCDGTCYFIGRFSNVNTGRARLIRSFHLSFFEIFASFLSFHVYNAHLIQTRLIWSYIDLKVI